MTILDEIIQHKYKEVEERVSLYPVKLLEKSKYFDTKPVSLNHYLQREDLSGIIAEFKRKSPSKGIINERDSVERVSIWYMQSGASALSILTDEKYFGGKNSDLTEARKFNYCPILRKDFTVDEYQVIEAKSIGADVILLIAAVLDGKKLHTLAKLANSLGMEVLMEIHNEKELSKVNEYVNFVGVNNRNLNDFTVSMNNSLDLADKIPPEFVKISESGINSPEDVALLRQAGFKGFLIGERFMRSDRPGKACANFINKLNIYI